MAKYSEMIIIDTKYLYSRAIKNILKYMEQLQTGRFYGHTTDALCLNGVTITDTDTPKKKLIGIIIKTLISLFFCRKS
jgi:hypothetical protein